MPLRAVVFDFDGVIADSEPLHFEGFRRVLARQGVALSKSEYYEKYLGFDDAGAFRAVLADHGQIFDEPRIATAVPLAIASGAMLDDIEVVLKGTGLRERFRAVVAADHTPRSKPHPDPYLRAVEVLRMQGDLDGAAAARDVVAIEDSLWGL